MKKLVSILIPVYNRESLIADAINSALSQNYSNIEIIIADNCSTDGTYAICKTYADREKKIRLYQNESNIGPIENFIKCAEYSKGDYIKYLLSDDTDSPDFLSKSVPLLTEGVGFVIAAGDSIRGYLHVPLASNIPIDHQSLLCLSFSAGARCPIALANQ